MDRVIPLTVDRVSKLRLIRGSRFVTSSLREHVAECGELCWQIAGTNEYIIGSQWRKRADIGHVVEMSQGPNRKTLLDRLLASFKKSGTELVVLACDDVSLYVSFYAKVGFQKLDEIIELERFSTRSLPEVEDVTIRGYNPADLARVIEVDVQSFPWLWQNSRAEFEWYSGLPGVELYVAENDDRLIVGYAGMTIHGPNGHLDRLAVDPAYQGGGYGAALLSFAVRYMQQRRVRLITLSTQVHNTKSQSLYRKFDFHHTFRSQIIYGLRLD